MSGPDVIDAKDMPTLKPGKSVGFQKDSLC